MKIGRGHQSSHQSSRVTVMCSQETCCLCLCNCIMGKSVAKVHVRESDREHVKTEVLHVMNMGRHAGMDMPYHIMQSISHISALQGCGTHEIRRLVQLLCNHTTVITVLTAESPWGLITIVRTPETSLITSLQMRSYFSAVYGFCQT